MIKPASVQIILPTLTVEDQLTLYRGDRRIDIRHLGRGHTGADLIVHLPREGVLITGDLVVWPIPLIGSTSYPAAYSATIEKLLTLPANIIIPGHGPVMQPSFLNSHQEVSQDEDVQNAFSPVLSGKRRRRVVP